MKLIKNLFIALSLILISGCRNEEETPYYSLESYEYLTHNSVLVFYRNMNGMNEYPSGIKITGEHAGSADTINYFHATFSPEENIYSAMIYDLLPDTKYNISLCYGHKIESSQEYEFKTKSIEYFVDTRDGQKYPIAQIVFQWWMLENLEYQTTNAISLTDSLLTGNYYTWESAKKVCPIGWHLPTDEEWIELERHIGISDTYLHDTSGMRGENEILKLLVPTRFTMYGGIDHNAIVNESGFSLKACGYFPSNSISEIPQGFGLDGCYWTSTEFSKSDAFYHGSLYKSFTGSADSVKAVRLYMFKENKMCIRCIKD